MSDPETSSPEAGWYPDPRGEGTRWWDGEAWTRHWQDDSGEALAGISADSTLQPAHPVSPSPLGTIVGLGSSLLLLLLTFSRWAVVDAGAFNAFDRGLPWFLTGASYGPLERGILPHGFLLVILALAALFFVVQASRERDGAAQAVIVIGVFIVLLCLVNAIAFSRAFGNLAENTTIGTGFALWLSLVVGMVIAASGGMLSRR